MTTKEFIEASLLEDIGNGDFSTLSCIDADAKGLAVLKIKEDGIIAGIDLAKAIFYELEPVATFNSYKYDGEKVKNGEIAFDVSASIHTILKAERLVLNCMQRMSGIATVTNTFVEKIKGYNSRILDTRKTTPLFRKFEKEAVAIGGGVNHRMGLYDMIMLKDNHIDFCGGIEKAIIKTNNWLKENNLYLKIEVETRNIDDVKRVIATGMVDRIMLDNFSPLMVAEALKIINNKYETEASGGINIDNVLDYAATAVDYISVGGIIHHAVSMDLSLKAKIV